MYDAQSYGAQGYAGNTSGQGEQTLVPPDVQGLNWGGLLLNWIWAIGNNAGILWIIIGLFFSPIASIYLLIKGNEIAWKNKRWESVEHFKATQRKWAIAGLIVLGLSLGLACVAVVLSVIAAGMGNA